MRADLHDTVVWVAQDKAVLDQCFKGHREAFRGWELTILTPLGVDAILGFEIRLRLTERGASVGCNIELLRERKFLGKWLPQAMQGVAVKLYLLFQGG